MHSGVVQFDPNTSTNAHLLVGMSDKRRRLTIYAPAAGTATLSNEPGVAAGQGITLSAGMAPLYLDVDFHGDCVEREWYVIYATGASGIAFVQTLCYGAKEAHNHDSDAGVRDWNSEHSAY
jgi:hypothetical protein